MPDFPEYQKFTIGPPYFGVRGLNDIVDVIRDAPTPMVARWYNHYANSDPQDGSRTFIRKGNRIFALSEIPIADVVYECMRDYGVELALNTITQVLNKYKILHGVSVDEDPRAVACWWWRTDEFDYFFVTHDLLVWKTTELDGDGLTRVREWDLASFIYNDLLYGQAPEEFKYIGDIDAC